MPFYRWSISKDQFRDVANTETLDDRLSNFVIAINVVRICKKLYNRLEVNLMKSIDLLNEKRIEILKVAELNGVVKISLFGSVARKQDNDKSDIDFLVEFEDGRTLFDLIRLKHDLESLLDKEVDVVTKKLLHPLIKEQVMTEAVEI
ncbi:nucleotidyltransferase family protein [Serpentinicella alkaliphila]|uniref:nucleotidyltransferase family protein n=1 Tax=Serpentinicella alkaliphila TaxID=1734049 RepID=UPI001BC842E4|nr:nucleotidyltransferase family protein [Serpentinicella alkaliphila]